MQLILILLLLFKNVFFLSFEQLLYQKQSYLLNYLLSLQKKESFQVREFRSHNKAEGS